jgi:excisionase family DNA binding protein
MSRTAPVVPPRRRSLMDAEEVGAILRVPASWVLTEARADRIPHVRLGRYVRFEEELLEAWCKEQRHGPGRGLGSGRPTT